MEDERLHEAIRELLNGIRGEVSVATKILPYMLARGFTAEETQAAVNELAKRA